MGMGFGPNNTRITVHGADDGVTIRVTGRDRNDVLCLVDGVYRWCRARGINPRVAHGGRCPVCQDMVYDCPLCHEPPRSQNHNERSEGEHGG